MKNVFIVFITLILFSNVSIGQSVTVFKGEKFEGAIFSMIYENKAYEFLSQNERFTPTEKEVQKFEKELRCKLKEINKSRVNQQKSCPVIHRNLKKYFRQYSGFIDNSGKKYLLVNFLWSDNFKENTNDEFYNELGDWRKHWQIWFDGCSHFWNVKYYLETDTLFDLQINGVS
ncbi:MAG: hypothetical protein O9282_04610 [Flavobacterium sp.]|jgi:hypothetical protein|uniref:hypothetical protein n=1 Tax=Flavobacterium sp. TaxID=239 RepID=UPI0022BFE2D8|nr:hypothetical protein [Flavobacterium sp.]MCZ8090007.1 hypothetical protein [Flavobacterium sp.]MCZ8330577.1 hypothetical protein [Flavobacterium sp.]